MCLNQLSAKKNDCNFIVWNQIKELFAVILISGNVHWEILHHLLLILIWPELLKWSLMGATAPSVQILLPYLGPPNLVAQYACGSRGGRSIVKLNTTCEQSLLLVRPNHPPLSVLVRVREWVSHSCSHNSILPNSWESMTFPIKSYTPIYSIIRVQALKNALSHLSLHFYTNSQPHNPIPTKT